MTPNSTLGTMQGDVPERLSAPGILDAARHEARCSDPGYLAVHELESADALKTDDYLRMSRHPVRNVYTETYPTQSDPQPWGRAWLPPSRLDAWTRRLISYRGQIQLLLR